MSSKSRSPSRITPGPGGSASPALDALHDGVQAVDGGGQIRYLNPAAEWLTGWREAEALGLPISTVLRAVSDGVHRKPDARTSGEGIENQATLDTVRRTGFDGWQGYHCAAPVPG